METETEYRKKFHTARKSLLRKLKDESKIVKTLQEIRDFASKHLDLTLSRGESIPAFVADQYLHHKAGLPLLQERLGVRILIDSA